MSPRPSTDDRHLDAPPFGGSSAILVVDEDPAFQLGLKTFLREYVGLDRVFTVRGGQEALDFIRGEPSIEVVTLDYQMAGMDGLELVRALRTQATHPLAVVMIAGRADPGLEAEFRSLGGGPVITSHFLSKPVQFERLEPVVLSALDEVLAAKRREAEGPAGDTADEGGSGGTLGELASRIEASAVRLSDLEREVRSQRGKWRADFWKLAFVLLLFWLAAEFGWLQRLEPHWERAKRAVKASFDFRDVYLRRADGAGLEGEGEGRAGGKTAPADPDPAKRSPLENAPAAPVEAPGQPL